MKRVVVQMVLVLAVLASLERFSRAGCGFDLVVSNLSATDVTVKKISTATPVKGIKVYKKQWEGSQVVAAGTTHTFQFSVDFCPSSKIRFTKVFYSKSGNATGFEDVEEHASGETQEVR